jgi:hypothetical protein
LLFGLLVFLFRLGDPACQLYTVTDPDWSGSPTLSSPLSRGQQEHTFSSRAFASFYCSDSPSPSTHSTRSTRPY